MRIFYVMRKMCFVVAILGLGAMSVIGQTIDTNVAYGKAVLTSTGVATSTSWTTPDALTDNNNSTSATFTLPINNKFLFVDLGNYYTTIKKINIYFPQTYPSAYITGYTIAVPVDTKNYYFNTIGTKTGKTDAIMDSYTNTLTAPIRYILITVTGAVMQSVYSPGFAEIQVIAEVPTAEISDLKVWGSANFAGNIKAATANLGTATVNATGDITAKSLTTTGAINANAGAITTTGAVNTGGLTVNGTTTVGANTYNLRVQNATTPTITLSSGTNPGLQIGYATFAGAFSGRAKIGDAVIRNISGGLGTNNIIFSIPNNVDDENSYIGFESGVPAHSLWFKIFNNATVRIDGIVYAKEVNVQTNVWSDCVFKAGYKLRSLNEVENFIKANNHLPEVPSEAEVTTKGINVANMNAILLQKVEELTLYLIELQKQNQALQAKVAKIENK